MSQDQSIRKCVLASYQIFINPRDFALRIPSLNNWRKLDKETSCRVRIVIPRRFSHEDREMEAPWSTPTIQAYQADPPIIKHGQLRIPLRTFHWKRNPAKSIVSEPSQSRVPKVQKGTKQEEIDSICPTNHMMISKRSVSCGSIGIPSWPSEPQQGQLHLMSSSANSSMLGATTGVVEAAVPSMAQKAWRNGDFPIFYGLMKGNIYYGLSIV